MDRSGLERVYLSKTDDELLALAVERKSLEPEAQSVLGEELRRRKLTHRHLLHPSASGGMSGQNLAWNLPAKVAAVVLLVGCGAFGLTVVIAVAREHRFPNLVLLVLLIGGQFLQQSHGEPSALFETEPIHPAREHRREPG